MTDSARPAAAIRLVHVVTVPWSLFFFRGQARFMQQHGLDVTIIASPGEQLDAFGREEGVATRAVPMRRAISPQHDAVAIVRLVRVLRAIRPTIVQAHTPKGGLIGMIAARLTRTPVCIYHIRGLPYLTASGWRRRVLKATEWVSCRLANRVFCVSHSIQAIAIADGLCSADKITVFLGGSGNGVDATGRYDPDRWSAADRKEMRASLGIGPDACVIGYVGRLVRDKGVEELATAWHDLRDRYPGIHLVLVGPEEPKDAITPATLAGLQADPRVHFTGDVDDTAGYYAAMDLLVLPTYREGFPNVPLEAAAMRLPVVSTSVPGAVDAVEDGVTGTLVPVQDTIALRDAIVRYIENPVLRETHGEAGRARVLQLFRQDAIWTAMHDEYARLLRARS